jgi:hypothetical protein
MIFNCFNLFQYSGIHNEESIGLIYNQELQPEDHLTYPMFFFEK